jgi:hypothetical protein
MMLSVDHREERRIMSNELEIMWKGAIVTQFMYPRIRIKGTEKSHAQPQDSRSSGRDLNPRPPEYEAGVLV